jgi:hypothetical protein
MSPGDMDLSEFRRLAEAWGGDIGRWPEARRAPARRIAATAEGAAILSAAEQLDALLAAPLAIAPDRTAHAAAQVMQRLAAPPQPPRVRLWWLAAVAAARPRLRLQPQLGFAAASLALSVAVGASLATAFPWHQAAPADQTLLALILDSASPGNFWSPP